MATFFAMLFLTVSHVLMKTLGTALLMIANSTWLMMYLVVDMSLFLFVKAIRRDFHYWVNISGALGWILSFIARFVVKLLVDFTCCVHFRHWYVKQEL
jgi:hypothetical protein